MKISAITQMLTEANKLPACEGIQDIKSFHDAIAGTSPEMELTAEQEIQLATLCLEKKLNSVVSPLVRTLYDKIQPENRKPIEDRIKSGCLERILFSIAYENNFMQLSDAIANKLHVFDSVALNNFVASLIEMRILTHSMNPAFQYFPSSPCLDLLRRNLANLVLHNMLKPISVFFPTIIEALQTKIKSHPNNKYTAEDIDNLNISLSIFLKQEELSWSEHVFQLKALLYGLKQELDLHDYNRRSYVRDVLEYILGVILISETENPRQINGHLKEQVVSHLKEVPYEINETNQIKKASLKLKKCIIHANLTANFVLTLYNLILKNPTQAEAIGNFIYYIAQAIQQPSNTDNFRQMRTILKTNPQVPSMLKISGTNIIEQSPLRTMLNAVAVLPNLAHMPDEMLTQIFAVPEWLDDRFEHIDNIPYEAAIPASDSNIFYLIAILRRLKGLEIMKTAYDSAIVSLSYITSNSPDSLHIVDSALQWLHKFDLTSSKTIALTFNEPTQALEKFYTDETTSQQFSLGFANGALSALHDARTKLFNTPENRELLYKCKERNFVGQLWKASNNDPTLIKVLLEMLALNINCLVEITNNSEVKEIVRISIETLYRDKAKAPTPETLKKILNRPATVLSELYHCGLSFSKDTESSISKKIYGAFALYGFLGRQASEQHSLLPELTAQIIADAKGLPSNMFSSGVATARMLANTNGLPSNRFGLEPATAKAVTKNPSSAAATPRLK